MMITGNIQNMQTLTGYIGSTGIKGIITKQDSQSSVKGYVQNRQTLTGHIKNVNGITGIITNMPEQSAKNDHVFVIVDLIKFHEQQLIVNSGIGLAFPSTTVSVNSMTANNIAFSSGNITVNKEVLSNATT